VESLTIDLGPHRGGRLPDSSRRFALPALPAHHAVCPRTEVSSLHRRLREELVTGASLKMTVEKAQHVPPVVDVPTAAAMLGIGRPQPTN